MKVGILAFQGDYKLHEYILHKLNVSTILVKYIEQLEGIDALIIPGGESTVMSKMIYENKFGLSLKEFSKNKSIYGTCAGSILMSSLCEDSRIKPLSIVGVQAIRNAWGRQIDSFCDDIKLSFSKNNKFVATFIRAPKLKLIDKNLKVLSFYKNEPILIRSNKHLLSSFHPEVSNDTRIHEYFIKMINE